MTQMSGLASTRWPHIIKPISIRWYNARLGSTIIQQPQEVKGESVDSCFCRLAWRKSFHRILQITEEQTSRFSHWPWGQANIVENDWIDGGCGEIGIAKEGCHVVIHDSNVDAD